MESKYIVLLGQQVYAWARCDSPGVGKRMRALAIHTLPSGLGTNIANDYVWIFRLADLETAVFRFGRRIELAGIADWCRSLGNVLFPLVDTWGLLLVPFSDLR